MVFTEKVDKDSTVKELVFAILSHEYPLKLIQLTNYIKKRYGKSVTFQAVRKAVLQLIREGVVEKTDISYQISTFWVQEQKTFLDKLHSSLMQEDPRPDAAEALTSDISVYTFSSLNAMMSFWQEIVDVWYEKYNSVEHPVNYYQASHAWEGLLHLEKEQKIMGQLKNKNIRSYAVVTSDTPLDQNIVKFYNSLGVKMKIVTSKSEFDRTYCVGTYEDVIIQSTYPQHLVQRMDAFFKNNTTIEDMNLSDLSAIVNTECSIKLTVIRDLEMAKRINSSIKNLMK